MHEIKGKIQRHLAVTLTFGKSKVANKGRFVSKNWLKDRGTLSHGVLLDIFYLRKESKKY